LTSAGLIQGELADITDTYEASVTEERPDHVDTASAVTHLRTELWKVYAQRDSELGPTDSGALVHLLQAVLRIGGRRIRLPHLTVFASEIVGFALISTDVV
jgi:hypothetical protein